MNAAGAAAATPLRGALQQTLVHRLPCPQAPGPPFPAQDPKSISMHNRLLWVKNLLVSRLYNPSLNIATLVDRAAAVEAHPTVGPALRAANIRVVSMDNYTQPGSRAAQLMADGPSFFQRCCEAQLPPPLLLLPAGNCGARPPQATIQPHTEGVFSNRPCPLAPAPLPLRPSPLPACRLQVQAKRSMRPARRLPGRGSAGRPHQLAGAVLPVGRPGRRRRRGLHAHHGRRCGVGAGPGSAAGAPHAGDPHPDVCRVVVPGGVLEAAGAG